MNGPAHLTAGVCAGLGAAALADTSIAGAAAAALGAVCAAKLPDVDRRGDASFNHRSVTHSALLAVPALVALAYLIPYSALPAALAAAARPAALGFVAGYASHLVLDAVTPKRIPLLTKSGPRLGLSLVNTKKASGMAVEWAVMWGSLALAVLITLTEWGGLAVV